MTYFSKTIMSLACLILVAGCDQAPTPTPAATKVAEDPITADVDRMEAGIRIADANKRIDELERQVGALQATPEKLDLELLTNRVEALEAKAGGDMTIPVTSSERSVPRVDQATRPISRASENRQDKPQKSSKLSMPELEPKSRLATTSEANEFNRTK